MGTITFSLMYGIYHQRKIQQKQKGAANDRNNSMYSSSIFIEGDNEATDHSNTTKPWMKDYNQNIKNSNNNIKYTGGF
jgi:hypothetical protein